MIKLILVRHGQSVWNYLNKFTGWTDVGLTQKGIEEARNCGELLKKNNIKIDVAYISVLLRAEQTYQTIKGVLGYKMREFRSWKLNERHYGALQGLNKEETAEKYGAEQVRIWRRSYDVKPPLLEETDARNPKFDDLYSYVKEPLPLGESLEDTAKRVVDYFKNQIMQNVKPEQNCLIVAHGNSLRALIQHLDGLNNKEVEKLELATGKPIVYELTDDFKVVKKYEF